MNPADETSSPIPVTQPMSELSEFSTPITDKPISESVYNLDSGFFPIHSFPSSSSSSFIPPQFTEFDCSIEKAKEVPQPLECLQLGSVVVPPFLTKTYDLVEDPALNMIISWGKNGESFVVWDPMEFGRSILPRNFKHNNFSSFVRQLNTYGFHKIDTDKWEFANEFFRKGKRHLLKNIQRRRSTHTSSCSGSHEKPKPKPGLEGEVERLKNERSLMLQEVIDLQQQQQGTDQYINLMGNKLQAAEQKQKKMVSFLANLVQSATCLTRLNQKKEQQITPRKFVKQRQLELGCGTNSDYLLEDSKIVHGQVMGSEEDKTKGKNVDNYQPDEYDLASFLPASSSEEKSLYQELLDWPEIENMFTTTQENPWSVEASEIWDNNNNSNNTVATELDSDIWDDLGHLQVEEPPVEDELNNTLARQLKDSYYYKKMDP